jgi:outer membrane protein insertion porin family
MCQAAVLILSFRMAAALAAGGAAPDSGAADTAAARTAVVSDSSRASVTAVRDSTAPASSGSDSAVSREADSTGAPKRAKVLDTLLIRGLAVNSPGVIRNNIGMKRGSKLSPAEVKTAIKKLYGLGLFRSIDVLVAAETDSSASLLLQVEEFPLCEGIEWSGLNKIKQKDLEEKLPLKRGQIVTDNAVFRARSSIKDAYAAKGYLFADVTIDQAPGKAPGNVLLKIKVKEGKSLRIRSITFLGNADIPEKKLKSHFKTKEKRWWRSGEFNEEEYRADLDTLVMYINDLGYLDAAVVKDSIWYSPSGTDIYIAITIAEGRKSYVGKFTFTGNSVIATDSLSDKILLREGKPFVKSKYEMSKYFIENAYRESGYLWVQVEDRKRYRGDTVDVAFSIEEGKPAIVRKVDIKGNYKTREKVIRREIDLFPGERYRQSLLTLSRQRIMALNFFTDVKPDITPNNDGTIDVIFDITEKENIGTFQVGAAYSQVDGFVGTVSLGIPNFRGAGEDLKIDAQLGTNRRSIDLGFKEPYAFDTRTSLSGEIFYNWSVPILGSTIPDTIQSEGFEVGIGRSNLPWPDNHWSIDASYRLSYEMSTYYADTTSSSLVKVLRDGVLSRITTTLMRYDLDMPTFPNSGSKLIIMPQIAGIGGSFDYFKGTVEYDHYFPLLSRLVLGSTSKIGVISSIDDGPVTITRTDLFKIGGVYGDADLRGYSEYSIGGFYSAPENGLSMFASTLELRYTIMPQTLYFGVFTDVGNTWTGLPQIDFGDLYQGIGFGIRVNIPMMGILGFDFGFPLEANPKDVFGSKPGGMQLHFLMNKGF